MGIWVCVVCELFLGGVGVDTILHIDTHMDGLPIHRLIDLPNDRMGLKETQRIQEVIRRQIP